MELSFDGGAAGTETSTTLIDQPAPASSQPGAVLDTSPPTVNDALVSGRPVRALFAVALVVAAVAAILILGG
jgi:hypothetical protein